MTKKLSQVDLQFLHCLIKHPEQLTSLERAPVAGDFDNDDFFTVYNTLVEQILSGEIPQYPELKLHYREKEGLLRIIEETEQADYISSLTKLHYALTEESIKRKLISLTTRVKKEVKKKDNTELLNEIEAEILTLRLDTGVELAALNSLEEPFRNDLQARIKRFREGGSIINVVDLPTGFAQLDEIILGLHRKNMMIIAGGTSDGKTQLAIQISNNLNNQGKKGVFFTLEDSADNLLQRVIALRTGISITKIRTGQLTNEEYGKVDKTLEALRQTSNFFVEEDLVDINDIVAKTKFAKLKYPDLAFIVVDYIGLATDRKSRYASRESELSAISKKLIALAKHCDVAVMALAQVNTSPDERSKGMPLRMNDIRDSKAIGHDAAVALFIHCPDKYEDDKNYSRRNTDIIVSKNRYGMPHKVVRMTNRSDKSMFVEGT